MFFRSEKTNIGGVVGLIKVSKRWRYAPIFSLIVLRISLSRKEYSLSIAFSTSKSSDSFLSSGKLYFSFSSL